MTTNLEKPAWVYDETYGFLNENARRLAEILNDWDPHLRLLFIPERGRHAEDIKPYAIAYFSSVVQERPDYFIEQYTETEIQDPAAILGRLWNMRESDPNVVLDNMEKARKALQLKKDVEAAEERMDMARSMIRSPFHTYRFNGKKLRF